MPDNPKQYNKNGNKNYGFIGDIYPATHSQNNTMNQLAFLPSLTILDQ